MVQSTATTHESRLDQPRALRGAPLRSVNPASTKPGEVQSKGFTVAEVRHYRDALYARNRYRPTAGHPQATEHILEAFPELPALAALRRRLADKWAFLRGTWRFPLWLVANKSDLFAFRGGNGSDGVCIIERVDLPDGRIVIACIEPLGNPGQSITNAVEAICFQVCERFDIPAQRLVWLEHYDYLDDHGWWRVSFESLPPDTLFENPSWTAMTEEMWQNLRLRPRRRFYRNRGELGSKLKKLFYWPTEAL